jgi:hypothetical protein
MASTMIPIRVIATRNNHHDHESGPSVALPAIHDMDRGQGCSKVDHRAASKRRVYGSANMTTREDATGCQLGVAHRTGVISRMSLVDSIAYGPRLLGSSGSHARHSKMEAGALSVLRAPEAWAFCCDGWTTSRRASCLHRSASAAHGDRQ